MTCLNTRISTYLFICLYSISIWLTRSLTSSTYVSLIVLFLNLLTRAQISCSINTLSNSTWIISYYILWSHKWIWCCVCFTFSIWIFRVYLSHVSTRIIIVLNALKQIWFRILILVQCIWCMCLLIYISIWLLRLSLLSIHDVGKLLITIVVWNHRIETRVLHKILI